MLAQPYHGIVPEDAAVPLLDGPREACGVFAAYTPNQRVANIIYFAEKRRGAA